MNALTAYNVMRKISVYDIILSTSNILFGYSTMPAVTILYVHVLNFHDVFLCVMEIWYFPPFIVLQVIL